jgi:hypothetical protein
MRRRPLFLSLVGGCIVVIANNCAWDQPNQGAFKPQPGAPCGNVEHECFDDAGNFNHACCPVNTVCGGGMGSASCPADSCCFIGTPPDFLKFGDASIPADRDAGPIVVIKGAKRKVP